LIAKAVSGISDNPEKTALGRFFQSAGALSQHLIYGGIIKQEKAPVALSLLLA
jgi:hypothetical protein